METSSTTSMVLPCCLAPDGKPPPPPPTAPAAASAWLGAGVTIVGNGSLCGHSHHCTLPWRTPLLPLLLLPAAAAVVPPPLQQSHRVRSWRTPLLPLLCCHPRCNGVTEPSLGGRTKRGLRSCHCHSDLSLPGGLCVLWFCFATSHSPLIGQPIQVPLPSRSPLNNNRDTTAAPPSPAPSASRGVGRLHHRLHHRRRAIIVRPAGSHHVGRSDTASPPTPASRHHPRGPSTRRPSRRSRCWRGRARASRSPSSAAAASDLHCRPAPAGRVRCC